MQHHWKDILKDILKFVIIYNFRQIYIMCGFWIKGTLLFFLKKMGLGWLFYNVLVADHNAFTNNTMPNMWVFLL